MKDGAVNYKQKYMEIRSKFISSLDVAYRMGFEQGTKEASIQQAQQQMQQAQMQAQQAQGMMQQAQGAGGGQPQPDQGAPMQDQEMPSQEEQAAAAAGQPSDIDQYITQIEDLVNKSENIPEDLKKAIDGLKIAKAKPALSLSFKHNLPESQKKTLTKQEEIVENLMKKWNEEANEATKNILNVVKTV